MNIQKMGADLNKLCNEWERNRMSPDLIDRGEWVRGVVYGIKLALRILHDHTTPPMPTPRPAPRTTPTLRA